MSAAAGPLSGIRIVEMAGLGPTPFCGMMLGDMGADVVRVERTGESDLGIKFPPLYDLRNRNKRSIALDLKSEAGTEALRRLIGRSDVLLEGFRPGVMERLGFGPEDCWTFRPSLVYARATGWGQDGPLAQNAGHDINYIALAGALDMIGPAQGPPAVPLNLLGDYAGGAMYMAFGTLCAIIEAARSGRGQIVDAAMMDGVNSLLAVFHGFRQAGMQQPRGHNNLDGGAPYNRCYATSDGRWMAVGAIEAKFYATFLRLLDIDSSELPAQNDRDAWPSLADRFAERFRSRTRDEWTAVFEGTDACVSPVLSLEEAQHHPHVRARGMLTVQDDVQHPRPAPRLSRTPGEIRSNAPSRGQDTAAILRELGCTAEEASSLAVGL